MPWSAPLCTVDSTTAVGCWPAYLNFICVDCNRSFASLLASFSVFPAVLQLLNSCVIGFTGCRSLKESTSSSAVSYTNVCTDLGQHTSHNSAFQLPVNLLDLIYARPPKGILSFRQPGQRHSDDEGSTTLALLPGTVFRRTLRLASHHWQLLKNALRLFYFCVNEHCTRLRDGLL